MPNCAFHAPAQLLPAVAATLGPAEIAAFLVASIDARLPGQIVADMLETAVPDLNANPEPVARAVELARPVVGDEGQSMLRHIEAQYFRDEEFPSWGGFGLPAGSWRADRHPTALQVEAAENCAEQVRPRAASGPDTYFPHPGTPRSLAMKVTVHPSRDVLADLSRTIDASDSSCLGAPDVAERLLSQYAPDTKRIPEPVLSAALAYLTDVGRELMAKRFDPFHKGYEAGERFPLPDMPGAEPYYVPIREEAGSQTKQFRELAEAYRRQVGWLHARIEAKEGSEDIALREFDPDDEIPF